MHGPRVPASPLLSLAQLAKAVPGGRVYLEFRSIEGVAGNALLATVVRSAPGPAGHRIACRFRGPTAAR